MAEFHNRGRKLSINPNVSDLNFVCLFFFTCKAFALNNTAILGWAVYKSATLFLNTLNPG